MTSTTPVSTEPPVTWEPRSAAKDMKATIAKTEPAKIDKLTWKSFKELTKFRLSQYNTIAAYSTYLYHTPMFMPLESFFLVMATQMIAMSSQTYNQVVEGEQDRLMRRTQNRPIVKQLISKNAGKAISYGLLLSSFAFYSQLANPGTMLVALSIWMGY